MQITAYGPIGVLCALPNLDTSLHGVSGKTFRTGKIVATSQGYGETSKSIFYIDGKRTTRQKAQQRLEAYVSEGQEVVLEGRLTNF